MKGVDSLIVIAAIAIFMAGVVVGMVFMALAAAAKRNNERIERAENMIDKIIYWLFQPGKDCKHCCLRCEYYDLCRSEVKRGKERKNEKF